MGTIKADTVTGLADPNKLTVPTTVTVGATILTDGSAGSTTITGEGGSTTTNLQQGLAKCWVNFDGTASGASARDSFNVSGMTDNGTGDYTITINNDMANDDYAFVTTGGNDDASGTIHSFEAHTYATGSVTANLFQVGSSSVAKADRNFAHATFHGDLA